MNILFITTSFPSNIDDPAGFFVYQLALALQRQGACVSVITPKTLNAPQNNSYPFKVIRFCYAPEKLQVLAQQPGGIPVALKGNRLSYVLVPSFLGSFAWNILKQAHHSDLIIANWAFCGLLAGVLKKCHKKPVITVLRGSDVLLKKSDTLPWLLKQSILLSNGVTCVGADHAEIINRLSKMDSTVQIIPNGIHSSFYKVPDLQPGYPLKIIFIGSLIQRKRVDTLLNALAHLHKLSVHVKIVGEGPLKNDLKHLSSKLGIEDRIEFIGAIPPGEPMSEVVSDSHILVLPSEHEGRPNVVIEAMAAGRPIIGSDISGIKELLTNSDSGRLFSVGDSRSLANCICEYYNSFDMLEESGEKARHWIKGQSLTWENTAGKYLALCQKVLSEHEQN